MAITLTSTHDDDVEAAGQISLGIPSDCTFVLFFCSSDRDIQSLGDELTRVAPSAQVMGCTTAGEFDGQFLSGSVVALAFGADDMPRPLVAFADDLTGRAKLDEALDALGDLSANDGRRVGFALVDGLSGREEDVVTVLNERSAIPFVGASAGDDFALHRTRVYADGRSGSNAAALAILEPNRGYEVVITHSLVPTDRELVAGEVDPGVREVKTFNGRPAAREYLDAVGDDSVALSAVEHPLGRIEGETVWVCSPKQEVGEALRFFSRIDTGERMVVLDSRPIVPDTSRAIRQVVERRGSPRSQILMNCMQRTFKLEAEGTTREFEQLFAGVPTAGFSTYGEICRRHFNQTAAILMLY